MTTPSWRLPLGVDHGVLDYVNDAAVARGYDASLAGTPLPRVDVNFVAQVVRSGSRLLDLGCGTGRLLVHMARNGSWVLGVDLSEEMLRLAGDKAASAGLAVHRLKANIADLACLDDGCFDTAACLFSTLGMVQGEPPRRRALDHVFRVLRPGGVFVLHVHNYWFSLWNPAGRRWLRRDWLSSWLGRPRGDCPMPAHGPFPAFTLHLFTRREVTRLLRDAGFRIVTLWPLGLRPDGKLPWRFVFPSLRAYGYLIAARKPQARGASL